LISRAEKDELQWKAKRLDALTKELRAIQIGSKPGLSTATLRDLLGPDSQLTQSTTITTNPVTTPGMGMSLLSLASSTAIPALLTLTLVTISLHASSSTSPFPPLRLLHNLITPSSAASNTPSTATIIYRTAKPMTGLTPHNLTFLVPFLVVGSAVVGWNVLCTELGIEFTGVFGKAGIVGRILGGVEEGIDIDWDGIREFFGMVEGV